MAAHRRPWHVLLAVALAAAAASLPAAAGEPRPSDRLAHLLELEREMRAELGEARALAEAAADPARRVVAERGLAGRLEALADVLYEIALERHGLVNLDAGAEHLLAAGNYLVYEPKAERWLRNGFSGGWQHANILSRTGEDGIEVLEAWEEGTVSRYRPFARWRRRHRFAGMRRALLVDMALDPAQQADLVAYQEANLAGKPHPPAAQVPRAKNRVNRPYCASLVWRSHLSSGAQVDLDSEGSPRVVRPVELVTNPAVADRLVAVTWGSRVSLRAAPNPAMMLEVPCNPAWWHWPQWAFDVTLAERNGLGFTVRRFAVRFYDPDGLELAQDPANPVGVDDFLAWFVACDHPSLHLEGGGRLCAQMCATLGGFGLGAMTFVVRGVDDAGVRLTRTRTVRLTQPLIGAPPAPAGPGAAFPSLGRR